MRSWNMMLCLPCLAALFGAEQAVAAQSSLMLSADMAFQFVCKEALRGDVERGLDNFLKRSWLQGAKCG